MGNVLVTLKIMPEGLDSNLDKITNDLKNISLGKFNAIVKEPIAFGLVALNVSYVIEDSGGITDELEEKTKNIEGVKTSEIVDATLV